MSDSEQLTGYSDVTRPWRTLVRCERLRGGDYIVVVPGWSSRQEVMVKSESVPFTLRPGRRYHAQVNIGAEAVDDLLFHEWEAE